MDWASLLHHLPTTYLQMLYEMGTLSSVHGDTVFGGLLQDISHPSSFLSPVFSFSIDLSFVGLCMTFGWGCVRICMQMRASSCILRNSW